MPQKMLMPNAFGHSTGYPFVGRAEELVALSAMAQDLRRADSACVMLVGERGIGKSRLVAELRDRATAGPDDDVVWLQGRCRSVNDGAPSLAAVRDLVSQLCHEYAEQTRTVAPEAWSPLRTALVGSPAAAADNSGWARSGSGIHAAPDSVEQEGWFCDALVLVMLKLAAAGPLVVVIEDVHLADTSTRDFIGYLQNRAGPGMMLVLTCRTGELSGHDAARFESWLAELRPGCRWWHELPALTPDESEAVVAAARPGAASADQVMRLHRAARGNPLLLGLLVEAGVESSPGLAQLASALVSGLTPDARLLVETLAALKRACAVDVLAELTGRQLVDLLPPLREAIDRGVLVERGDQYEFRHPAVGDALYDGMLGAERVYLHRSIASVLAGRSDAAVAEQALHCQLGGDPSSAVPLWLAAAAEARDLGAVDEMSLYAERVLDLLGSASATRGRASLQEPDGALEHRLAAHRLAADSAAARSQYARALGHLQVVAGLLDPSDAPGRAAVHERCAALALACRDRRTARTEHERVRALVGTRSPVWAQVLAGQAHAALVLDGDLDAAVSTAGRAAELARHNGDDRALAKAQLTIGLAQAIFGVPRSGGELIRDAVRRLSQVGDLVDQAEARTAFAIALVHEGDYAAAVDLWEQSGRHDEPGRWLSRVGLNDVALRVLALTFSGRLDDAARLVEQAPAETRATPRQQAMVRLAGALLQLRRGDLDGAGRRLRDAESAIAASGSFHLGPQALLVRTDLAIQTGLDGPGAAEAISALRGLLSKVDLPPAFALGALVLLARAAADGAAAANSAEREVRMREAKVVKELLAPWRSTAVDSPWTELLATADAELGRLDAADPDGWAALGDRWNSLRRPYEAAYAWWREAEACLLQRPRRRSRAREALVRAHTLAERIGALHLAEAIAARARRARLPGVPAVHPAPPSPAAVVDGQADEAGRGLERFRLTGREHEVLGLVSSGHSNPEIAEQLGITPRTAGVHVSRILAKLGVSTRAQAAALVHRLKRR
ncbi:AAA family ATPase [Actinokineospora guangxiensis]|uniref:AAA family ATPase n=1 Tax=Actinokineospora guangxiensis TaxID=1490288 RepID=A0ABW0ERU0_9PSEU